MWSQFPLHNSLQKTLTEQFPTPTLIQSHTLTHFNFHQNFLISSPTGTGKTMAFMIPILNEIMQQNDEHKQWPGYIRAMIIVPTRELGQQIHQHTQKIALNSIRVVTLIGGMSKQKQQRLLSQQADILIATPGRLWDLIQSKELKILDYLHFLDYLVLDEADRMVELGHFKELNSIIDHILKTSTEKTDNEVHDMMQNQDTFFFKQEKGNQMKIDNNLLSQMEMGKLVMLDSKGKPIVTEEEEEAPAPEKLDARKRKIFLVSATITKAFRGQKFQLEQKEKKGKNRKFKQEAELDVNAKLNSLTQKLKLTEKPKIIDLTNQNLFPLLLKEFKTLCIEEDKFLFLYNFIENRKGESFIVFNNSVTYANKVTQVLKVLGMKVCCLHSNQQQRQRLKKLDKFKSRDYEIIVCTDVAARGLDIPNVQNVVHFQVPRDIDTYIHRSGRTARNGQIGNSYALVGPKDQTKYLQLCKELNREQGIENIDAVIKDSMRTLITNALAFESSQHQFVKSRSQENWFKLQSKETDIDIDDDIQTEIEMMKKQMEIKKKQIDKESKKFQSAKDQQFQKSIGLGKRKSVFLDPSQMKLLCSQMEGHSKKKVKK